MTVDTERRKRVRNRPRSLVYVELESANGGMMRDLSEEGFAVRAVMPLRAGEKTQFAFSLNETTRISGEGRIVWTKEDGRVAGIEFCGIPRGAREEIRKWLVRADEPAAREPRIRSIPAPEPPPGEALCEEARPTLSRAAPPSAGPPKTVPTFTPEELLTAVAIPPGIQQPREEAHPTHFGVTLPPIEPLKAVPSPEPESSPVTVHLPPPREEKSFRLPRVAIPSVEAPKAAHSAAPESLPAAVHVPPPVDQTEEEARFTLPRVALPSSEPAKAAAAPEQEVARAIISESAEVAEVAATLTENATAPSPKMQAVPHDITTEMFPSALLEPGPVAPVIEPLPELPLESEFSEAADSRTASHFLLKRAIGVMLLLALIAGAVVYHREVGHALMWLGQVIAGPEEAPRPQSSVAEPPAQATPLPETTLPERVMPASSPGGSNRAEVSSPEGSRAVPSETQPGAVSGDIEVPPVSPAMPPTATKTQSAPVLQPTSQQNGLRAPGSSSVAAADTGQQEYQQAEQILRNSGSEAELQEAVRLLWVAVEKGNNGAEVALAELYRRGQGVAKNCDQARILLSAAARKGSVEAEKHLDELVREGCQ